MSGSSLDGIDIAYCRFDHLNGQWKFEILEGETIAYTKALKTKFSNMRHMSALAFARLHSDYGHFIGSSVRKFMDTHTISPDFIASHGQTIFHQPDQKYTSQIGNGAAIAAETGCTVICDFRSTDVALGGQGAPLVPVGDEMLFADFDACLNIGGFANISYRSGGRRIAYDICPSNGILNYLASKKGKDYDENGSMAQSGIVLPLLLRQLNGMKYYKSPPPKSLGVEWVDNNLMPLLTDASMAINDLLRTCTEHIAIQISDQIKASGAQKTLATGGGVYNRFLAERINALLGDNPLVIPDEKIVDFKEAMIFAFLGVLRMRHEVNCLKSVTGASRDSCGGAIYYDDYVKPVIKRYQKYGRKGKI